MSRFPSRLKLCFSVSFLGTLLAVILRTVACLTALDSETGYFRGSLPKVADLAVLALILFFATALLGRPLAEVPTDVSIPSGMSAFLLLGSVAVSSALVVRDLFTIASGENIYGLTSETIVVCVGLLCCFAGLAGVLLSLRTVFSRNSGFLFSKILPFFFAAEAALLFFNKSRPLNDPTKITDQMAFLALAFFLLYETRISAEREKSKLYFFGLLVCALLCAYASLPVLIRFVVEGDMLSVSAVDPILFAVGFLFAVCRLFDFARAASE